MTLQRSRIDLNADLGEERVDDAAIFPVLSSANIACGAHAGGSRVMDAALAHAARLGIAVGAHVSYEDRPNFGRTDHDIPYAALKASLTQQISKLQHLATRFGIRVEYVKPHGALYHRVGVDEEQARALVDATRSCDPNLELLVPFSASLRTVADPMPCRHEFFADRGYSLDGRLVDRTMPGAQISDVNIIVERTRTWLESGEVQSVEGKQMRIVADSICVHGDNPHAVLVARALHAGLTASGIRIVHWNRP